MAGRAAARKVVEEMGRQNGYIPPELLDTMKEALPQKAYDDVLEVVGNLKNHAAASVKTLAQNLYSSSAKFVFELLQNYDDNHYNNLPAGSSPSVSFQVYSDCIVASCNEDGFTEANVTAICSVGQSSKKNGGHSGSGADGIGYTGEKGIGFKSVFMAAEDVHIQSGDYSFRFQYAKDDSGLGMTTPIWTEHDEDLADDDSYITLTLRKDGTPDEIKRRRAVIREQFETIHDSILLFMRKLEHIRVETYHDDDHFTKSVTSYSVERHLNNRTTVKKCKVSYDENEDILENTNTVKHYVMIKHVVPNLAPNDNRRDLDETSRSDGVVVLGFPVDKNSIPVVRNEYLFAFLPVKQMGFKFLIHADFVTQANREDIVTTSERNQGLAEGIADAFIKAVLWFRDHDTLQYHWMRYLPHDNEYPWGGFWQGVIKGIRNRLARTPIMVPEKQGEPHRLICESRRLPNSKLDSDGKPLIEDAPYERYVSQNYNGQDLLLLKDYGLAQMSIVEWLERVQYDIGLTDSTIKSFLSGNWQDKNDDWGERVANMLVTAHGSSSASVSAIVRRLEIVPLRDKKWIAADPARPVYYPQVKINNPNIDLDVPQMLDLNVVESTILTNTSWRKFFDLLGVQAASATTIRNAIVQKHQEPNLSGQIPNFVAHVQFLYKTHHLSQPPYCYHCIKIVCDQWYTRLCSVADCYIADNAPYGVELLLPTKGGSFPSEYGHALNNLYMENIPGLPTPQSCSWKEWLYTFIGVRRHLRLVNKDGKSLSNICKYVAEHRPEKFVDFLQANWENFVLNENSNKAVLEELAGIEVLCRGGSKVRLASTYLPLNNLEKLAQPFLSNEVFSWLQLEADLSQKDSFPRDWENLGRVLGLGYCCSSVIFLLDVLCHIAEGSVSAADVKEPERICSLYVRLQSEVRAASSLEEQEKQQQQIRDCFATEKLIYAPAYSGMDAKWVQPGDCVMFANMDLLQKVPLNRTLQHRFPLLYNQDSSTLDTFFSKTVGVRNWGYDDIINELVYIKSSKSNVENVHDYYKCLSKWQNMTTKTQPEKTKKNYTWLKEQFTEHGIIFGGKENGGWYTPAQCLWTTSSTRIPGMLTLNSLYPGLHDFFVKGLDVKTMTIKMVYTKLMGPALTIDETKQTLETFNALLSSGKDDATKDLDVAELLAKPIFPVRVPGTDGGAGGVQLCKGTDDFAFIDRQSLADTFAGRAKLFDFGLEGTRRLQPFLKWARLSQRGLSTRVEEISCVAGDDQRPIASRDRSLRHKARALLSVAMAFNSPRCQVDRGASLYRLLRGAETLEADTITSELKLRQDGKVIKVKQATATFHLEETDCKLVIHVPRNKKGQELCFSATLPQRFCTWLMTNPTTQAREYVSREMVYIVQSVLGAKSFVMAEVLDHNGIRFVNVPTGEAADDSESDPEEQKETEDGEEEDVSDNTPGSDRQHNPLGSGASGEELPITSMLARSSISVISVSSSSTAHTAQHTPHSFSFGRNPISTTPSSFISHTPQPTFNFGGTGSTDDTISKGYTSLLESVVKAARETEGIPTELWGTTSTFLDRNPLKNNLIGHWLRGVAGHDRHKQIGAAGELYIFETLSRLNPTLPGFSRDNWQSTIRSYARQHPVYADMLPWSGLETADITYDDTEGVFTKLLRKKGYLRSLGWEGARPKYYIEIKTTVNSAAGTPFFMSSNQYDRMQQHSEDAAGSSYDTVYMIFRVFGLGAGFVGVKLLLDPERMRRNGQLNFTTPQTWSVSIV